jgi:hypothetical protein
MTAAPPPRVLVEAEPFIAYVKEEDFAPQLKPVVEPYKKRMGFLPNALKLYAHRPEIAETLWKLNSNIMRDPSSTLDQLLKAQEESNSLSPYRTATHLQQAHGRVQATAWTCASQELQTSAFTGRKGALGTTLARSIGKPNLPVGKECGDRP